MNSTKLNMTKTETNVSKSWDLRKEKICTDLKKIGFKKNEIKTAINAITNIQKLNTSKFNAYSDDALYFTTRLIGDIKDIKQTLSPSDNETLISGVIQEEPEIIKNNNKTCLLKIAVKSDDKKEKKLIHVTIDVEKKELKRFKKGVHLVLNCTKNKDSTLSGNIGLWDDYTF